MNFLLFSDIITSKEPIIWIIAPLISSIIQSRKEYKLRKLELSYIQKFEALKALTAAYDKIYFDVNFINASHFQKECLNLAVLCSNIDTRNSLIALSEMIMKDKKRTDKIDELYNKCIKKLFEKL